MTDARLVMARESHRQATEAVEKARRHRVQRDHLIRNLRAEDPKHWTYQRLAIAIRCSPELIAHIVRQEQD